MWEMELVEHTADLGVKITADSLPELFKGFGIALLTLLFGAEKWGGSKQLESFTCESPMAEDLLVDFLNEILFYVFNKKKLPVEWKTLKISRRHHYVLEGEFFYVDWDASKMPPHWDIKSATYHNLRVRKENNRWTATVVFDI
ncbi:MAG: archease [bacterium]